METEKGEGGLVRAGGPEGLTVRSLRNAGGSGQYGVRRVWTGQSEPGSRPRGSECGVALESEKEKVLALCP